MNKYLKDILTEMCNRVDAPLLAVNCSRYWYQWYSWSPEEQESFEKWLLGYLKKNKKAQQELYGSVFAGKKLEKAVEMFVCNYGWTVFPVPLRYKLWRNFNLIICKLKKILDEL